MSHPARASFALACGALLLLAGAPADAAAQARRGLPEGAEQAYLSLRHAGTVDTVLTMLLADGQLYLPLAPLLSVLGIDVHTEPGGARTSGFYLAPARRYVIDLDDGRATLGGRAVDVPPQGAFIAEGETFVTAAVLEALFGFAVAVDLQTLNVQLTTRDVLPVVAAAERARRRQRLLSARAPREPAPLRFGFTPRLFDGGVLQYALSGRTSPSGASMNGFLGVGSQVLGGELQATSRVGASSGSVRAALEDVRWRRVFGDSAPAFRHLSAGRLLVDAPTARSFWGVEWSNEPLHAREMLGTYPVMGEAGPGWEVELWVNHRLVDHAPADADGRFRFDVPLRYGTTVLEIVRYGPAGQVEHEDRRLQIPFVVVPAGRLDYSLRGGLDEDGQGGMVGGDAAYGLTPVVSVLGGVEAFFGDSAAVLPRAAVSGRPDHRLIVGAEAVADGWYRVSSDFTSGVQTTGSLGYTWFPAGSRSFPGASSRPRQRLDGRLFGPVRVGKRSVTLYGNGNVFWVDGVAESYQLFGQAQVAVGSLRPSLGYRHVTHILGGERVVTLGELTPGVLGEVRARPFGLGWVDGALLFARAVVDAREGRFRSAQIDLSRQLDPRRRLGATLHLGPEGVDRLDIRVSVDHPAARATGSGGVRGGLLAADLAVSGGVGWAPGRGGLTFSDRA
ncbi:MAG TPA: hypothetical protein VMK65_10970, partial [Longimicrobiales bacterium]|nr:hypothetical protein [Longimicrobiales bacterium]